MERCSAGELPGVGQSGRGSGHPPGCDDLNQPRRREPTRLAGVYAGVLRDPTRATRYAELVELGLAGRAMQDPGGLRRNPVENLASGTKPSGRRSIHETQRQPGEYHRSQPEDSQDPSASVHGSFVSGPQSLSGPQGFVSGVPPLTANGGGFGPAVCSGEPRSAMGILLFVQWQAARPPSAGQGESGRADASNFPIITRGRRGPKSQLLEDLHRPLIRTLIRHGQVSTKFAIKFTTKF